MELLYVDMILYGFNFSCGLVTIIVVNGGLKARRTVEMFEMILVASSFFFLFFFSVSYEAVLFIGNLRLMNNNAL